jgi:integrase
MVEAGPPDCWCPGRWSRHSIRVSMTVIRCLRAAGLPRMRLHDLRHRCATILLASGLPVKVVSEKLGHSSASMTLDIYGHVFPATRRAAA